MTTRRNQYSNVGEPLRPARRMAVFVFSCVVTCACTCSVSRAQFLNAKLWNWQNMENGIYNPPAQVIAPSASYSNPLSYTGVIGSPWVALVSESCNISEQATLSPQTDFLSFVATFSYSGSLLS